ncbi:MAG: hypothetical protein B6I38_01795, partial [Anaerolineaceae bacterium 4572_5.1]
MKQRLLTTLLLALLLLTLISVPLIQAQEPKPLPPELLAKIDPRLLKELAANNGSTIPIIIEMKAQADLTMDATLRVSDEVSRRATMVNALQATANASQVGVRAALIEANAREVRSLWIVNAVAAQTTLTTALQLAARDNVAQIRPDEIITLPPFTITEVAAPLSDTLQWGVEKIEANAVWQSLGIDGDGVVVANIDTGVDFLHPDLQKRYRGYQSAVLPLHDAFQWILTPEGDPALAPDVVNNSWGSNSGSSAEFEDDVQLLLDAGIIPIFSAGNSGPNSGTVGSPGSYSFAVGATDSDDVIASFSSRGPSPWGEIKPDVSAPGVNILSSLPGGGYGVYNGTSMAAPHVSGLTALLLQADDSLSYPQLTRLLTETALSLGGSSPNNTYGWGRVDAYNALQTALNAGQLVGTVSDKNTAQAIAGAEILITPRHTGYTNTAATNAEGFYRRGVAENDYNLSASAFAYQTQNRQSVIVTAGSVVTEDFEL